MVSDSTLVDEQLNPLGITLWGAARFPMREAGPALREPDFDPGQAFSSLLGTWSLFEQV